MPSQGVQMEGAESSGHLRPGAGRAGGGERVAGRVRRVLTGDSVRACGDRCDRLGGPERL